MAQQTAVEWLEEKFNNYDMSTGKAYFRKLLNEAKQIEKEQIVDAYINGQSEFDIEVFREFNIEAFGTKVTADAEQYYNETYNK